MSLACPRPTVTLIASIGIHFIHESCPSNSILLLKYLCLDFSEYYMTRTAPACPKGLSCLESKQLNPIFKKKVLEFFLVY